MIVTRANHEAGSSTPCFQLSTNASAWLMANGYKPQFSEDISVRAYTRVMRQRNMTLVAVIDSNGGAFIKQTAYVYVREAKGTRKLLYRNSRALRFNYRWGKSEIKYVQHVHRMLCSVARLQAYMTRVFSRPFVLDGWRLISPALFFVPLKTEEDIVDTATGLIKNKNAYEYGDVYLVDRDVRVDICMAPDKEIIIEQYGMTLPTSSLRGLDKCTKAVFRSWRRLL